MLYLFFFILLVVFAFYYDIKGKLYGLNIAQAIVVILLICIAGFRYRLGIDTVFYCYSYYHETPLLWNITLDDLFEKEPLFVLFSSLILSLGLKFYVFQIVHAAIVNILLFKYIKRHSIFFFTCAIFYFLMMFFPMNMEEMRASISIVISLFANDYLVEKKWVKALLLYLLGFLFHYSSILLVLTPIIMLFRVNMINVALLMIIAFFTSYYISINMEEYLTLLEFSSAASDKINDYFSSDKYLTQNGNIYYMVVSILPYILYPLLSLFYLKRNMNGKMITQSLLKLQHFLLIGVITIVFTSNIYLFYRYTRFYSVYFILYFSYFLVELIKNNLERMRCLAIVRAIVIFLPLFLVIAYSYKKPYVKYYPYSSVFDRKIDKTRELYYNRDIRGETPWPVSNEY